MKKFIKIKILFFVILFFGASIYPVLAWVYPENATGYPYANSPEDQVDQWNTYTRNCTSYVMWKINQAGVSFNNNPTGPNGRSITMGNAGSWDENASSIGYSVDTTPQAGNPVNWEPNSTGAGPVGHVAWVERVNANGTIFLSEWNWNYGNGKYNERDGYNGDHYLHITNGADCSNISNKIVNSGVSFSCNRNSITVNPESKFYSGSNVNLTAF